MQKVYAYVYREDIFPAQDTPKPEVRLENHKC